MAKLPSDTIYHYEYDGKGNINLTMTDLIRCKDCKYFHYDKPYVVYDIPVLGHEVCDKWGDGCKTSENGFCFMAERKGEEE